MFLIPTLAQIAVRVSEKIQFAEEDLVISFESGPLLTPGESQPVDRRRAQPGSKSSLLVIMFKLAQLSENGQQHILYDIVNICLGRNVRPEPFLQEGLIDHREALPGFFVRRVLQSLQQRE